MRNLIGSHLISSNFPIFLCCRERRTGRFHPAELQVSFHLALMNELGSRGPSIVLAQCVKTASSHPTTHTAVCHIQQPGVHTATPPSWANPICVRIAEHVTNWIQGVTDIQPPQVYTQTFLHSSKWTFFLSCNLKFTFLSVIYLCLHLPSFHGLRPGSERKAQKTLFPMPFSIQVWLWSTRELFSWDFQLPFADTRQLSFQMWFWSHLHRF